MCELFYVTATMAGFKLMKTVRKYFDIGSTGSKEKRRMKRKRSDVSNMSAFSVSSTGGRSISSIGSKEWWRLHLDENLNDWSGISCDSVSLSDEE